VALQFHDVQIKVTLNSLNKLVVFQEGEKMRYLPRDGSDLKVSSDKVDIINCSLFVDYIYLDNEERTRFASEDHMYLCEQLQTHSEEAIPNFASVNVKSIKLTFNHPVKELIWTVQNSECQKEGPSYNDWFNFSHLGPGVTSKDAKDLLGTAQIRLNTHDRFTPARQAGYFRLVQPANHHTRIPDKNIYVYSFAINPEEYQPSGSCNFSRIDNVHLIVQTADPNKLGECSLAHPPPGGNPSTASNSTNPDQGVTVPKSKTWSDVHGRVQVYALSLNQLKISGGLGGLQYAN
jgi:hypothetical protein